MTYKIGSPPASYTVTVFGPYQLGIADHLGRPVAFEALPPWLQFQARNCLSPTTRSK